MTLVSDTSADRARDSARAVPLGAPVTLELIAGTQWDDAIAGFEGVCQEQLLYPLGAAAAAALFFRSASLRGKVRWKGRSYETDVSGRLDGPAP
jgi:hypothetical protein